jgi:hypothetical protein
MCVLFLLFVLSDWWLSCLGVVPLFVYVSYEHLLAGVFGMAICFDLWMSRKGHEIMSMDAQYLSEEWVFSRQHLGLINCSSDTGGVSLFKKARRLLRRKKMLSKVSGYFFVYMHQLPAHSD